MALNEEFESRIGKGTKASGKLNFRGPVKIEGEAEGEITGEEVVIATGAVVSARISASKVTIAGSFSGEVTARERVELMATARVQCTINTPELRTQRGRAVRRRLQDAVEEARSVGARASNLRAPIHFI